MEIETKIENKNKNKEQRKNKLGLMSFIKCVPKAKKNKRKFMLFHPQMGPKNKTSFVQKRCQVLRVFRLLKMLLNLVLFCCFLCVFPIREHFVLPKFVFHHEFGLVLLLLCFEQKL